MRPFVVSIGWMALVGCGGPDSSGTCAEEDRVTVFADVDGDGFGAADIGTACSADGAQSLIDGDCDDENPDINPNAADVCDQIDNDCSGAADEDADKIRWYDDDDQDGFGDVEADGVIGCAQPDGFADNDGDCDDDDPQINPDIEEICNDSVDDDCDGLVDDEDVVDPAQLTVWWHDADNDGFGDDVIGGVASCKRPPGGPMVTVGGDCDDTNPGVAALTDFFVDADGDGYGDSTMVVGICYPMPGYSQNGLDCDDTDDTVTIEEDWLPDLDGDGAGLGASVAFSCTSPGPDTARASAGVDCDDDDPGRFPGNTDICEDGIDQDCSGADLSCGPIASFVVGDGPNWANDPPVYSCLEACALLFGGVDIDYYCSTDPNVLNHLAYLDGWADMAHCSAPLDEAYRREDPNNLGYDCMAVGCSYSAYVTDHGCLSVNYCWLR